MSILDQARTRLSGRRRGDDRRLAVLLVSGVVAVVSADGPVAGVALLVFVTAAVLSRVVTAGRLHSFLFVVGLLMALPALLLMIAPWAGGSTATRGATVLTLGACLALMRSSSADRSVGSEPEDGLFTWVGLGGLLLIINTYVLRGSGGTIALMDHDHVFHAAVTVSAWVSDLDPGRWATQTAGELLAVPSAIHWSMAAWTTRVVPAPMDLDPQARVLVLAAQACGAISLGWLATLMAARSVRDALPAANSRGWTLVSLICVLVGPVLWLRYTGMWPAVLAAGFLGVVVASMLGTGVGDFDARRAGPAKSCQSGLPLAVVAVVLSVQAWPLVGVPITLAAAILVAARRRTGHTLLSSVQILAAVGTAVVVGGTWTFALTRRSLGTLAGGIGGLGLPDWRVGALVVLAVAVLTASTRIAQPVSIPTLPAALLVLAAVVGLVGVVMDYWFSLSAHADSTYYAGKLGLVGLIVGVPAAVPWLATGANRSLGQSRYAWHLAAGGVATFCLAVWLPWDSDYSPYPSVGLAPGISAVSEGILGNRPLASDQAAADSRILGCDVDGVIRWTPASDRVGRYKYSAMWTAVVGGRTDPAGWAVTGDAYPPLSAQATVDQQLPWFGLGGSGRRTIAWVVPDGDAILLAERIRISDLPDGLTVVVMGATGFDQEAQRCSTA